MARFRLLADGVSKRLLADGVSFRLDPQQTGGIEQVGGNGGDIQHEDDAHGDASRDLIAGGYSDEDMYLKSVAFGWLAADGLTPAVEKKGNANAPHYVYHVNTQNGDGVGTATTTWRGTRHSFTFDDGKTHLMSATGLANRWTKFGSVLDDGAHPPFGYDGVDGTFGATTILNGNNRIYGSHLRQITTQVGMSLTVRRNTTSEESDIVTSVMEVIRPSGTGSAALNIGTSAAASNRCRGSKFSSQGATTAVTGLQTFNVQDAQKNDVGGSGLYLMSALNAKVFTRDMLCSGAPSIADIKGSAGGEDHVDLTWSGRAAQVVGAGAFAEWRTWLPTIVDVNGSPQSGIPMELLDGAMAVVVSAVSDSQGQISYSSVGITGSTIANAVKVRSGIGLVEAGPFTVRRNGLTVQKFIWPRTSYVVGGTTYYQLLPVYDTIGPAETLKANFSVNPGGGVAPLTEQFTDQSTTRPGDAITAWAWDFGDGFTDTVQNPSHVYAAAGTYNVSLTVTDASGQVAESDVAAVYVASGSGYLHDTVMLAASVLLIPSLDLRVKTAAPNKILSQYVRERIADETGYDLGGAR